MSTVKQHMKSIQFSIEQSNNNQRLDHFLCEKFPHKTRATLQRLIKDGWVLVNELPQKKGHLLHLRDELQIFFPEPTSLKLIPEDIPLDIVYEDDCLLVVNKPKGMVVHPAPGHLSNTLVHALLYHCGNSLSGINGKRRPGIVHRIDKNTSGLLLVAKHDQAHQLLAKQIQDHTFLREYQAIVYGDLKQNQGIIQFPIGRHPIDRKKMSVITSHGKSAETYFRVLERFHSFNLVSFRLRTGRTHQIRVHMSYIGHPIAGDEVYGPKKVISKLQGQCLHAKKIGFVHPQTQKFMVFDKDPPPIFLAFLAQCESSHR